MIRAVVDVGSNSILLLVSEQREGQWKPILEASRVTGLGVGTKTSGLLGEAGMASTLEALADFRRMSLEAGAPLVRCGATMAVRIANNSADFLNRAATQGTPVEVISGEQEAELGFKAVATDPVFQNAERLSIIDPGGHSTEMVTCDRQRTEWVTRYRKSFPVGALGLREEIFTCVRAYPRMVLQAIAHLDEMIGLCYRPNESGVVVSLGATGTNLITIRDRILEWDSTLVHGQRLDYEEISRAAQWLLEMNDEERAAVIGIEKGREKSLHIGALILERFLFALRAESCIVSTRGWRFAYLELDPSPM